MEVYEVGTWKCPLEAREGDRYFGYVIVDSLICVRVSLVVNASELFWVRQFASVFNSTAREIVFLAFVLRWFGTIPFLPVFFCIVYLLAIFLLTSQ